MYNLYTVSPNEKLTDLQEFFNQLATKVLEARTLNRVVYGIPASIGGFIAAGSNTDLTTILSKIMAFSMILFHPLEHGWFFSTLTPRLFSFDGNKWSIWSVRCWVVYIICDLIGTVRTMQDVNLTLASQSGPKGEERSKLKKLQLSTRIWLTCIIADLILGIQYSVEKGPFSDHTLAWASFWGGLAGMYRKWINSQ